MRNKKSVLKTLSVSYDCSNGAVTGIAGNVPTLGEEADLEANTFSLAQTPIGNTNVQFSTKPAFLPNVC